MPAPDVVTNQAPERGLEKPNAAGSGSCGFSWNQHENQILATAVASASTPAEKFVPSFTLTDETLDEGNRTQRGAPCSPTEFVKPLEKKPSVLEEEQNYLYGRRDKESLTKEDR